MVSAYQSATRSHTSSIVRCNASSCVYNTDCGGNGPTFSSNALCKRFGWITLSVTISIALETYNFRFEQSEDKDILTSKSVEIEDINSEETKQLIQDLKDTLNSTAGCGISAVQIGELKRICLIKINGQIKTLINPVITKTRGEVEFKEGCLSAPDIATTTKRAQKVWVDYIDENGRKKELAEGGLCSIIVQHELDHFDGICKVHEAAAEAK